MLVNEEQESGAGCLKTTLSFVFFILVSPKRRTVAGTPLPALPPRILQQALLAMLYPCMATRGHPAPPAAES